MKYSFDNRKKEIGKRFIIGTKICDCCNDEVKMTTMWVVKRYNQNDTFDNWYYCLSCFDSKDEVLVEIDSDSYPYGIHPIDFKGEIGTHQWATSLSEKYRDPKVPLHSKNLPKKRVRKIEK